ncbi:MAG: class I SAM-dependent methyltransferase [Myxococcota bacterium]
MTDRAGLADAYARWRASALGAITERVEARVVLDLAGPLRGRRVLDVGTGDGTYAIEAARRGARATGLDVDPAMISAARSRSEGAGVDIALREGRAEALPFDDGTFDVVVAVTVLCFVPDPAGAVREMGRVLVPGGRLVLGELGRFSVWAAERRVRGWLGSETWRHARFWSRSGLEALVREAGLRPFRFRGSVFFPPSGVAARLVAPLEPWLTRMRAPGAAFLALAADKVRGPVVDR